MLATTLALPSCKDDDKTDTPDNPSNNEEEGEAIEGAEANAKAVKFWDVASQLVGTGAYTIDYADATFEPTIGTADGNTRIVLVNDMQAAAQKFADITGADIDEETASYTYNDPEIGTLTYTKVDDGTTWATVDVSIKQIPHLEKIIFRNSTDDNGSFDEQKAWYRFGDVVKRTNTDGEVEYWICVRPAFTYEKKEESHWVCVSKLSKSNIYSYSYKAQNTNYYLPTKVGTDKENMQNFAEMLYAICYPQEWYDNALNYHTDKLVGYSGVPIFSDFTSKNLKYHNQYFWQNVQAAWKNNTEIQTSALNLSLSEISSHIKTDGVNLLYKGYSWWKTEGNCDLYNASYTTGTADKEKNLHKADLKTVSAKIYTFDVDCRTMGKDIDKYNKFFNDNKYRWVIRHATGKDLNGGVQPAATAEIQGVTEVYRYYSHYPAEKERKGDNNGNGPEISVASLTKNSIVEGYFTPGDVVKTSDGSRWICVAGSPSSEAFNITDHEAYFISFDNVKTGANSNIISSVDDAIMTAYRICDFLTEMEDQQSVSGNKYIYGQPLVGVLAKVKELTGVEIPSLFTFRDSTWTFKKNGVVKSSTSSNYFLNIAYGSNGNLLRYVMDVTRAGKQRADNPTDVKPDWYHWFYTKYEKYDESQMKEPTEHERDVYLYKKWHLAWPMSSTTMNVTDVSNEALVATYAKESKWVTLPETNKTERQAYRTSTSNYTIADYAFNSGQGFKTNMFNEPVSLMRLMKVEDDGTGTLIAPDGTPIEILYHNTDVSYNTLFRVGWVGHYLSHVDEAVPEVFLNNQPYNFPAFRTKQ